MKKANINAFSLYFLSFSFQGHDLFTVIKRGKKRKRKEKVNEGHLGNSSKKVAGRSVSVRPRNDV